MTLIMMVILLEQRERPMPADLAEQEIRAFVGRNATYYLGKWANALSGKGRECGFNWAACLFSGFWFPYRKMYIVTVVYYAILFVETVAEDILCVDILHLPDSPMALQRGIGISFAVLSGILANRLYLSHTRTKIEEIRNQQLGEEEHLKALTRQGGTNLPAAFGMFFLLLCAIFSVMFLLESLRELSASL